MTNLAPISQSTEPLAPTSGALPSAPSAQDVALFQRAMAAKPSSTVPDSSGISDADVDKAIGDTIMANIIRDTFRWKINDYDIT